MCMHFSSRVYDITNIYVKYNSFNSLSSQVSCRRINEVHTSVSLTAWEAKLHVHCEPLAELPELYSNATM
jgi:hypothetical protein